MIVRIVKLKFRNEHIEEFRNLTREEEKDILNFRGCNHLEVKQDIDDSSTFFTISHWDNQEALDIYRASDFFRGNWNTVKPWFDDKPQAWSVK